MALPGQLNTALEADPQLTIVLVGGGSGGHITPILAVAEEIKKLKPHAKLVFIGQTGDKLLDVPAKNGNIDEVYSVRAGKFRRYHGEGFKQWFDLKTWFYNLRDVFYVISGTFQSYKLLKKLKPQTIFIKGGFVGVPVGLAAAIRRIPYVTHDSDAVPGLANRIISPWAAIHAVALPKEVYKYPADKTFTVGVPISLKFQPVTVAQQLEYKTQLGLGRTSQVVFVTGGGMGAQRLNEAVVQSSPVLLTSNKNLIIIHATGRDHEDVISAEYKKLLTDKDDYKRVIVKGFFVDDLYKNSGAADVVICRAGATNLAELAAQHKTCIVVPNPMLTSGHQLKNASYLEQKKAVYVLSDEALSQNHELLITALQDLLNNPEKSRQLSANLGKFAKPRAAKELAELIIEALKQT